MEKQSRIEISDPAIVSLVEEAATSVEGVHNLHGEFLNTLTGLFRRRRGTSGMEIMAEDDHISLNLHLVVKFGSFIPAVVSEVKTRVRKGLEGTTPLKIKDINIYIEDLHLSK